MKLNLGCGGRKLAGYVNVDISPTVEPDLLFDLEQLPWPFDTGAVEEIQALHVLEHIGARTDSFLGAIKEMYRVCCDNALVVVVVPHHHSESFFGDPTHVRAITAKGMTMFSKDYCRAFAEQNWSNTRLAEYLDVDFGIASIAYELTPYWRQRALDKTIDIAELSHAVTTYNNVVEQVIFELRVVKSRQTQEALGHTDGNISYVFR
jgi:predicted SAM-dependent methyltransferase